MKKRGFTLLELVIVVIILGVLATLGIGQYFRVVEKSRSAEARQILGQLRDIAAGYYTEYSTTFGFDEAAAGIGPASDQIPFACRQTNWFRYHITVVQPAVVGLTALRCGPGEGGKPPDGPAGIGQGIDLTVVMGDPGAGPTESWTIASNYL